MDNNQIKDVVAETLRLLELTSKLNRDEFLALLARQDQAIGFERFADAIIALVEAKGE